MMGLMMKHITGFAGWNLKNDGSEVYIEICVYFWVDFSWEAFLRIVCGIFMQENL